MTLCSLGVLHRSIAVVVIAVQLAACTTTLSHKTELRGASLEIGSTDKSEVAEMLGLPSQMRRDADSGREFWAYQEKPSLAALHYAVPTSPTSADMHTSFVDSADPGFTDAELVCVFNRSGVLEELRWSKEKE